MLYMIVDGHNNQVATGGVGHSMACSNARCQPPPKKFDLSPTFTLPLITPSQTPDIGHL
jgi:hypothetical protein